MTEKRPKIFVVYKDASVGVYPSEAKALDDIREHDRQGSEVKMAIIGHELGMIQELCEVVHCFTTPKLAKKLNKGES